MGARRPIWWARPSTARALLALAATSLLAIIVAGAAFHVSPFMTHAGLPLAKSGLRDLYLTTLSDDPEHVLLTARRENSTWTRDMASQTGDLYRIRRYGDPARPGLPERVLLANPGRDARLLIPLGALDLERALSTCAIDPDLPLPRVTSELVLLNVNRRFAGLFLELRFPPRALGPLGEPLAHDVVVVRGDSVRTTDFLLAPGGRFYRSSLANGVRPMGVFQRNPHTGDEVVFVMGADGNKPARSLYVPVPLFPELALCWGEDLETLVDDRRHVLSYPIFEPEPPSADVRATLAFTGAMHLAARFEDHGEQRALARAIDRFSGS